MKKKRLLTNREDMTLPDERYRAVASARELLLEIANPGGRWKRIPKELRLHVLHCLRHFPTKWDMDNVSNKCPEVFQERMEPLTKMLQTYKIEQEEEQNGKTRQISESK